MECVFCKIVSGEAPAYKIWENEEAVAVLDIFPKIRGQVVVIYKTHADSDVFNMENDDMTKFYLFAKRTAEKMKKALGVRRVVQVMEGLEVEHAHLKLFPVYSVSDYEKKIHAPATRMLDTELAEIHKIFERG